MPYDRYADKPETAEAIAKVREYLDQHLVELVPRGETVWDLLVDNDVDADSPHVVLFPGEKKLGICTSVASDENAFQAIYQFAHEYGHYAMYCLHCDACPEASDDPAKNDVDWMGEAIATALSLCVLKGMGGPAEAYLEIAEGRLRSEEDVPEDYYRFGLTIARRMDHSVPDVMGLIARWPEVRRSEFEASGDTL